MSIASTTSRTTLGDRLLGGAQSLGRSLMLPIAVLPAAALLLRFGQNDIWAAIPGLAHTSLATQGIPWMATAGDALFGNLPIIFAVGIALGLAGGEGAAALAGLIGFEVFTNVFKVFIPQLNGAPDVAHYNMGVLSGIVVGVTAAWLYRRFYDIRLPDYLAFFGGKRFVPIITAFVALILGVIFGLIWAPIQGWINALGVAVVNLGAVGTGIYGFLNRLLIPLGLHHVLNFYVWQQLGSYHGVTGDLNRYFAGDPSAGNFMAGFFPVMMFGLPAAALAMVRHAKFPKVAAGILLAAALTSFLTGVTEPIEFAFIFIAPLLFLVHALLTGLSLAICTLLSVRIGFGFSAGLIDLLINFTKPNTSNPWLLILIGLVYAVIYYFVFSFCITRFNLATPGRGDSATGESAADWILPESQRGPKKARSNGAVAEVSDDQDTVLAGNVLEALGGSANVESVEGCITRLRLFIKEPTQVDDARLKALGASGVIKRGKVVQVVMGTQSDRIAERIKGLMKAAREDTVVTE